MPVLETTFVSNKKNDRSIHHDSQIDDDNVPYEVLYWLAQNYIFGRDDIGRQLTLPPDIGHWPDPNFGAALENPSGYSQ